MEGADRRVPGEKLLKRMEERTRRRPRLGMTPAFYTRLGLEDPWAVPGESAQAAPSADGMTFLSAAPYYAMLEKLAASRRRRERRAARFAESRPGSTLRASKRSWPGEAPLHTPRIASLALEAMRYPEAPAPVVAASTSAEASSPEPTWRRPTASAPAADPWKTLPFVPARVIRGKGPAPADYAGVRLARASADVRRSTFEKELRPQAVRAVAHAQRELVEEGSFPEEVRVIRRTRLARPAVRFVEEAAQAAAPPPVERAALRGTARAQNTVARLPGSRSPSIQMATLARAAETDQAAAGALAAPERGEAMRPAASRRVPATQRASARGESRGETGSPLSASPVSSSRTTAGRPLAASPVVRAASAAPGSAPGGSDAGSSAVRRGSGSPVSVAPGRGALVRVSAKIPGAAAPDAEPTMFGEAPPLVRRPRHAASSAAVARAFAASESVGPVAALEPSAKLARTARLARTEAGAIVRAPRLLTMPGAASLALPERAVEVEAAAASSMAARGGAAVVPAEAALLPRSTPTGASIVAATPRPAPRAQVVSTEQDPEPSPIRAAIGSAARAGRRGAAAALTSSSIPQAVVAEAGQVVAPARPTRRIAAVKLADGAFVPASQVPELRAEVAPPPETPRAAVGDRLLDRGLPPVRLAGAGSPRAPESVLPAFVARAEVGAAATESARGATTIAVPSSTVAAPRLVVPSASPAVGWAAARIEAATPAKPARSVMRRATPPNVGVSFATLERALERELAEEREVSGTAPRTKPSAPSPARASRSGSTTQPVGAPRVSRSGAVARSARPGSLATATRRNEAAAPMRRANAPVAVESESVTVRREVRRSGPLSWARPVTNAPFVGSFAAAPPRARDRSTSATRSPDAVFASAPPAELLAELQASGQVQSTWSPSTPVRTPSGTYVSARVAAAMPNLAVIPAITGPVAISTARPVPGVRPSLRGSEVRYVASAAPQGAASSNVRPTEWVSARAGITQATAFRGAMSLAAPAAAPRAAEAGVGAPARGRVTRAAPDSPFVGAPRGRGVAGTVVRGVELENDAASPVLAARRTKRAPLETTLAEVSSEQVGAEAPTWAARSDGTPRVRSGQGLFDSLARATTAEQVVQVIAARAGELEGPVPMTEPMRSVVDQLRQELRSPAAEGELLRTRAPEVVAPEASVLRPRRSADPVPSSAIVRRGSTRPVRSSAIVKGPGGADDRVSKLVRRLTDLIHLAETERRLSEAQSQVRMAEDSAAARAEGSAPVGSAGGSAKLDIEAFSREVLEVVNRELELRRERQTEDGDGSGSW